MKKLEQMNKTDKVDGELARRLKQYDADVLAAAKARNAGRPGPRKRPERPYLKSCGRGWTSPL